MNRAAVGVGSWLLRSGGLGSVSLDMQETLLEAQSFAFWQAEHLITGDSAALALRALVREVWQECLDTRERSVLRGTHLESKSDVALARELGIHPSTVRRCRAKAEEKMRGGLHYVMRYRELLAETGQETEE